MKAKDATPAEKLAAAVERNRVEGMEELRAWRGRLNLTQEHAARWLHVSVVAIASYENGRRTVPAQTRLLMGYIEKFGPLPKMVQLDKHVARRRREWQAQQIAKRARAPHSSVRQQQAWQ